MALSLISSFRTYVLFLFLAAALCGCAATHHSVAVPEEPYILPGPPWWRGIKVSVVGPQAPGWKVAGGMRVTNDIWFIPQDMNLTHPRHANFLMFSKYSGPRTFLTEAVGAHVGLPPKEIRMGAFVLPESVPLPKGGLEELREQIVQGQLLEPGLDPAKTGPYAIGGHVRKTAEVTITTWGSRPCVRFVLDDSRQSFKPLADFQVRTIIKIFWIPRHLRQGSEIVRVGYVQYLFHAEELTPVDLDSEVAPVFETVKFIHEQ